MAASLPANARCESTAPLGIPEEPDVKTMSAAPSSIERRGGVSFPSTVSPLSSSNLARVFERVCATAPSGELRSTGTTTPPASQTPR